MFCRMPVFTPTSSPYLVRADSVAVSSPPLRILLEWFCSLSIPPGLAPRLMEEPQASGSCAHTNTLPVLPEMMSDDCFFFCLACFPADFFSSVAM